MKKIILNEQQLQQFIGLIVEEQHYPRYLEMLRDFIVQKIESEIKIRTTTNFDFTITDRDFKNDWFSDLKIIVIIKEEFPKEGETRATYINNTGKLDEHKKLQGVVLTISVPPFTNKLGKYNIDYYIFHELTHLYEDWKRLNDGGVSLSFNNRGIKTVCKDLIKSPAPFFKAMGKLLYMSMKAEQNAFVAQTYNELEALDCTDENYKEVMKQCMGYIFYNKIENEIIPILKAVEDGIIKYISDYYFKKVKQFPRLKQNETYDEYRNRLIRYAEALRDKFLQKFYSIVSLYVNDYKKENNTI